MRWATFCAWVAPPLELPRAITTFALAPDGRMLATFCAGEAQLWSVETRRPLFPPARIHMGKFAHLNFSDDSRWLACVTEGKVFVMNTVTGEREREFPIDAIEVAFLGPLQRLIPLLHDVSSPMRQFDFRTGQDCGSAYELPGFDALLLPNTPTHAASAGLNYDRQPLAVGVFVRWVDAFRWAVGPFQGPVESYAVANLTARYTISKRVSIGLDVSNLFADRHWQSFGGDLMGTRALANLRYGW